MEAFLLLVVVLRVAVVVVLVEEVVAAAVDARAFLCCRLYLDRSLLVQRLLVAGNDNSADDETSLESSKDGAVVDVDGGGNWCWWC